MHPFTFFLLQYISQCLFFQNIMQWLQSCSHSTIQKTISTRSSRKAQVADSMSRTRSKFFLTMCYLPGDHFPDLDVMRMYGDQTSQNLEIRTCACKIQTNSNFRNISGKHVPMYLVLQDKHPKSIVVHVYKTLACNT
jgi:hypothetical protein